MNLKMIFAATALAAMTMSSCSSDTPVDATENIARGETTYATFNLSLNTTGSRANGDNNADAKEQTVKKMHLYIFGGGVLEVDYLIPNSYSFGTKVGPVKLTTGEKVVYAIAGDLKVNGTEYKATVESTRLSDFEKILFNALASDIAVTEKFLMAGSNSVTVTKSTEQAPCQVTVSITRAATKTQLKYGNAQGKVNVRPTINATFANPRFVMMQCAETMWLTPGNYTQASKPEEEGVGTYTGYTAVPETVAENLFCDAVTTFNTNINSSRYTGEAYNENPVTGNTTFALVRLKATPEKICDSYDTDTKEYNFSTGSLTGGTFYVIAKKDAETASYIFASDNDYNILYFASSQNADEVYSALELGEGWEVLTYTNGYVYYRVNLMTNPDATDLKEKYCALRNHFYKITVTDIKALGAPNAPGVVPTDPDQPLEADAWLAATITAEPWVAVDMNNTTLQ